MAGEFQVSGNNGAAKFTLTVHRGDGMALLAMNWKKGRPPRDFVGFAIEYREPDGDRYYPLKNRLSFPDANGKVSKEQKPTRLAPIQKFRWVHFPRNAELPGEFIYRVMPVFMNDRDELSYGEAQEAAIELRRETYPKKLNVTYTRGFISSQAFVERYDSGAPVSKLLPAKADAGLTFKPSHPEADEALRWMGFEVRDAILEVLDEALADKKAEVRVVAYDLNEPEVVARLEKLGSRLRIIIDDDGAHAKAMSAESKAAKRLAVSAGQDNVKRQHMGNLQHNKTIVVDGPKVKAAVCGSTNFTWRGLYVQSNNAVIVRGNKAIAPFRQAFDDYWNHETPGKFGKTQSATWADLGLAGIDARVAFSPHSSANALLPAIAADIGKTRSNLFYSLAFLYQTRGAMRDTIKQLTENDRIFVYGVSDRKVGGIDLQKPSGNRTPVYPSALAGSSVPEPFKSEPTGGGGNRMHHKFLVVDFDKPSARVYFGSYNFSTPADRQNGENLLLIRDRRVAVSFMIEALRIVDHYHFRVAEQEAKGKTKTGKKRTLQLRTPPRQRGEKPWWDEYYTDARKVRDRKLFA